MKRHTTRAALAVFLFAVLGSAQAAAPNGYTLPTRDGRCAMWITAEADPPPGESTTWSGDCRNGLGQGVGIQEFVRADGSRLRYTGPVRDGRWHGRGRLQQFAADGRLLHVVEGMFEHGVEQGVFNELFLEHPQNGSLDAIRQTGRAVGADGVQVQQFYVDGAAVLMCAPDADCLREAAAEGYEIREAGPGDAPR
jgi:hypothetical protein